MPNHSTIRDSSAFFTIVPETRQVTVPQAHKLIGVVGDHLAEQLTFEIPQYIDGHDIAGCARRYVSWANVDGELGTDALQEPGERPAEAREGMLYFTWTVRDRLAAVKGLVQFSVHFEDVSEGGELLYHWGTTNCKNCEILDSVNNAIGAYAAIYVADDTLIFSDCAPVERRTLSLETPGIVPEGKLEIRGAGTYDVGQYALAEVVDTFEDPTISVDGATGLITADANGMTESHQLSAEDCADFVPENILAGKNVLGVTGTLEIAPSPFYVRIKPVTNAIFADVSIYYNTAQGVTLDTVRDTLEYANNHIKTVQTCVGSIIMIPGMSTGYYSVDENGTRGVEVLSNSQFKGNPLIAKVTARGGSLIVNYHYVG